VVRYRSLARFGREFTEQLLARGHRVAATLRRPEQLDGLAARHRDLHRLRLAVQGFGQPAVERLQ